MSAEPNFLPLTDGQVARIQSNSLGLGISHFTEANIDARRPEELTARLFATLEFRHYPTYSREAERIFERLREQPKQSAGALARYRKQLYRQRAARAAVSAALTSAAPDGKPLTRGDAIDLDLKQVEDCLETSPPKRGPK